MKVLLVGSGGREHALAWKIARSPLLKRLVCAPGNPGMAMLGEIRDTTADDAEGQVALAREVGADLVVLGPETAIAAGLADRLSVAGIPCFGPTAGAGRLESSKAFAKAFAQRHGIPSGRFGVFGEAGPAKAFLAGFDPPFVVKADGLAAGKGVVVATTLDEAEAAVDDALGGRFGAAGARVVIEAFMEGEIASLFALCDGETNLLFGGAQDHKRAYEGERGPNTGGMGAYSPAPVLSDRTVEAARSQLIEPALAGIAAEGAPYRGVLFCEMMVSAEGPRLIEFNARFGDPECQVLMMRLNSDILPYLSAAATGRLARLPAPEWREEAAICVVLAAEGYPGQPSTGQVIAGAEADFGEAVTVFHAGTARRADGALIVSGGRVLNVCARGPTLAAARDLAYRAVDHIDLPGGFHRRDIGWRALGDRPPARL
ncbi:MAG: phosphoribosylamine--glycine ligase [Caulobacteraceae bacterium]|nr:phosphoribosylamine--glycine ligase [Caulobacteraceae bacterium]